MGGGSECITYQHFSYHVVGIGSGCIHALLRGASGASATSSSHTSSSHSSTGYLVEQNNANTSETPSGGWVEKTQTKPHTHTHTKKPAPVPRPLPPQTNHRPDSSTLHGQCVHAADGTGKGVQQSKARKARMGWAVGGGTHGPPNAQLPPLHTNPAHPSNGHPEASHKTLDIACGRRWQPCCWFTNVWEGGGSLEAHAPNNQKTHAKAKMRGSTQRKGPT